MSDAFEHLADPEAVIIECGRLLKPGGRIFISFPPYGHPYGEHLTDLIGIPYVQLFFSEADMTAAYARLAEDLPADRHPNGAERVAFRFTKDADGTLRNTYINKMTLKRFEEIRGRIAAQQKDGTARLKTVLYREKPLRAWLLPLAKLLGIKEHFVRMAVCVLEKPDANISVSTQCI